MARFDDCLAFTLKEEGGFSNNPADPGGATNFGITQATLSDYLGRPATLEDVQNISHDTVAGVYTNIWNALLCNQLPVGVDLMVFDFGVNAGNRRSVLVLQSVVGAYEDGLIGDETLAAVHATPVVGGILHLADEQCSYYRTRGSFPTFGRGWLARTERRKEAALASVGAPCSPQQT